MNKSLAINIERIFQAYFSHYANIYRRAEQASVPASRAIVNCAYEIFAKRFHCGFAKWPASFAYVRKDFWRNVRDWVRNMHSTLPQYYSTLKFGNSEEATKFEKNLPLKI